jgi:hypothetical protein
MSFVVKRLNICMQEEKNNKNNVGKDKSLKGSKSDPQKTEMKGLKKGGVEPAVHTDDKAKDEKGKIDE